MTFSVLTAAKTVEPFVDAARSHADSEKVALGFTPASAYREASLSGKLFVAVTDAPGLGPTYAGHLLFGGTFPYVRIFQVYVAPKYRRKKVGALLLQTLVKRSEDLGYLSISARVAGDLVAANAFWEREGFRLLRFKKGGSSRARTIGVLTRELDTPKLFPGPQVASLSLPPMRIPPAGPRRSYVIDLNVFLDLVKVRTQAEDVRRLLAASWTRLVDVFVAEELVEELRRARAIEPDPILEFASSLPRLPKVSRSVLEENMKLLAHHIFPEKTAQNSLSTHDDSDLAYLATSIHHGVNGFITGEKAILKRAEDLRRAFGLDVVGTTEFTRFVAPTEHVPEREIRASSSNDELAISEMTESDRQAAFAFLQAIDVCAPVCAAALSPGVSGTLRRRIQVTVAASGEYVGFASWDAPIRLNNRINVYVFVDEDHPDAVAVATHLYTEIMHDVAARGPKLLTLSTPEGHQCARTVGASIGFGAVAIEADNRILHKVSVGGVVTASNWSALGARLKEWGQFSLEGDCPIFKGVETKLRIRDATGEARDIAVIEAERLFGPALFLLPMRHGMLVPIRREFAEQLFSGTPQLSLLPKESATLFSERVYFRAPNHASSFSTGVPIVFYESLGSNGRGCAFTLATVQSNRVVWAETLSARLLMKGVLKREYIMKISKDGLVSQLHFESIIPFRQPVRLDRLRAMGAIDGANAVAPRRLEGQTLIDICTEANILAL